MSTKAKAKRAEIRRQTELINQKRKQIEECNALEDALELVPMFKKFDRNGVKATLVAASRCPEEFEECAFKLIEHNMKRKKGNIHFYEFGNCYDFNAENKKEGEALSPYSEEYHLGIWVCGNRVENNWAHPNEKTSIYELKAYVENILVRLGVSLKKVIFGNLTNDIYDVGLSLTTQSGKALGSLGIVSHKICKAMDIDTEVYYAELRWTALMKETKKNKVTYTDLSKFPGVKRDLALLIDKSVAFAEIQKIAFESERKLLKEVTLFDVYEGKNLPEGKKSYAVSFFLEDETKTLNDKQIDAIMKKIQTNLEQKVGAQLR